MTDFTPKYMLELPRPGAAIPSPSGIRFAQISSTFSFKLKKTVKSIFITEIPSSGESPESPKLLLEGIRFGEAVFVDDDNILYLKAKGKDAQVDLTKSDKAQKKIWDASEEEGQELWSVNVHDKSESMVGEVPVDIGDLKVHVESADQAVLAFSATVYHPSRSLDDASQQAKELEEAKQGSSVRVYDKLMVRHWDTWLEPKAVKQIHVVHLKKSDGKWAFEGKIHSPMKTTRLESPVGAFGGSSDFDISSTHLVFTAKCPNLNRATHTTQHIYVVPLHPKNGDDAEPKSITVSPVGATSNPTFSPTAKHGMHPGMVAWCQMTKDGYEADQNKLMLYDFSSGERRALVPNWDRSAASIDWSQDGQTLFITAEENARVKVFQLDISSDMDPIALTSDGGVSDIAVLPTAIVQDQASAKPPATKLLLSRSSMTTPKEVLLYDNTISSLVTLSSLASESLSHLDLDKGEEFWFDGAYQGQQVHGWILRPPSLLKARKSDDKGKEKYPMAFLVHGGPQGAWDDSWSTRWNPNVFAAAGYVTIAIDPTGSTSYGQKFTDAIKLQWGGLPYQDLVAGYQHVLKTFSEEIDADRTVALGASYGGYMMNWFQGHNPGFKALVCHDGVFSTSNVFYATEELWFPMHDFGSTPYENSKYYDMWNPRNHIENWSTPMLIIQGGKDFRLPETEALGMFNVLQQRGIPSRLVYFEEENHWVLRPENSLQWHSEVLRWLDEWVGADAR